MPRKSLKIDVTLNLRAASCPGVWLYSNNEVYMSVCLFGQYQRTRLAEPVFPILFQERFKFEKIFYTAIDPSEVSTLLESESVLFELVQLSEQAVSGAQLLASYEDCAKDFLYPYPQLSPTRGSMGRELLMERSPSFPGIAPKIEFGTKATVVETTVPRQPASHKKGVARGDGNAEEHAHRICSSRNSRTMARSFVYPDEDEENKGYQLQTISSLSRSRSPSPGRLNLSDLSLSSPRERPHFLGDTQCLSGSASPKRQPSPARHRFVERSVSPTDRHLDYCLFCSFPHGEGTCAVCRTYRQHTGHRYWGHTYLHQMTEPGRLHCTAKVQREPVFAPSRAEESSLSDDSDIEGSLCRGRSHRRTWSTPITQIPPPRPVSPVVLRRSFRDRFAWEGSGRYCRPDDEPSRLSRSPPRYGDVYARHSHSGSAIDSLAELEIDLDLARERRY